MTDAETEADRRAPHGDQPQPHRSSWSSTTWTFVRDLGVKVTVLHEGSVLAEGSLDQVSENDAGDRSLSGAR